jgi:hypothetical protein
MTLAEDVKRRIVREAIRRAVVLPFDFVLDALAAVAQLGRRK